MKPGKRGQITAFVIIGIIIVAAALTVIYINKASLSSLLRKGEVETLIVPEKLTPVKDFIETCFKDTISNGISLLSLQGGYIDIEEDLIPRGPANPFSNSLNVLGNNLPVSYWFYEQVNGIKTLKVPTINSMQLQLESYIDSAARNCLDYSNFENEGFIFNEGNIVSKTKINENSIEATINYPLAVFSRDLQFNFNRFSFNLPSSLGKLYNNAVEVLEAENTHLYLENKTLDFMSVYDEVPYLDVDLDCVPKTYVKQNIEKSLKNILATNIPLIKVKGNQIIDRGLFFSQASADESEVNFNFNTDWPMQFDVVSNPNEAVLRGEPYTTENKLSSFVMPLFCMNSYNFAYNIKYPVLISLNDGNEVFQFATQVIIDHNQPRNAAVVQDIELLEESLICKNPSTKLRVNTMADINGNFIPLDNVRVSLQCVDASCNIGYSDTSGVLEGLFPGCINGILSAEKEGYHKSTQTISTLDESEISIVLDPLKELKVDVKVMDDNIRSMYKSEQAFIQLDNLEKQYSTAIIYPGFETVKLVSGNYNVRAYLMLNSSTGIYIQDQTVRVCQDLPKSGALGVFGITEEKCVQQKIEGTTLTQVLNGGNEFLWEVSSFDLANSKVTFFIKSVEIPTNYNQLTKVNEKIKKNPITEPVFSNE